MSKITENDLAGYEARCRMREGQKVEVYAFNLEQLCRLARLGLWAEEHKITIASALASADWEEPGECEPGYVRSTDRALAALAALPSVSAAPKEEER